MLANWHMLLLHIFQYAEKISNVAKISEELRPHILMAHFKLESSNIIDFKNCSSWQRLLGTILYMYTFLFKIKFKQRNIRDFSTIVQSHVKAENFRFTQIQSR